MVDSQDHGKIVDMLCVFLEYGIDAVMGPLSSLLDDSIKEAEQRSGQQIIRIYTPSFDLGHNPAPAETPMAVFDECARLRATFCLPHQSVTDALIDRRAGVIRDLATYTRMIRERGWSKEKYAEWLTDMLTRALLP